MTRQRISSGRPWESIVGYSRAVRVGNHVWVSGTSATNQDGTTHAPGDAYAQAKRCFEIIEAALVEAGATLADVVRTRMLVTDISRWEEFGRAHSERFDAVRPATTMVQVSQMGLIDPEQLIEIEVEAIVDD